MSVTDERKKLVSFTRATTVVDELLVSKKGDATAPKALTELLGKTITTRASSSYRETLDKLATKDAKGVVNADADETRDTEHLVFDVGQGKIPYTVCDSDWLAHIMAYNKDVESTLVLRNNREIAFAVRPANTQLKTAADAWLIERALSAHAKEADKLDLEGIKKRGSIRMLTRNNAVSYFLFKGTQQGFDYEWVRLFAKENGLRLDVVVPPESKDLIPWLNEGRGDLIAAEMTVTPERAQDVWFSPPYNFANEVIVQKASEAPITDAAQLKGKTLSVRSSSSYRRTLDGLQASAGPFTITDAAEDEETEAIIGKVAAGTVPLTVADSTIAAVEKNWRNDIQTSLSLSSAEIAIAARKDSPKLQAAVEAFVKKHVNRGADGKIKGSVDYNVLHKQYFETARKATESKQDFKETGKVSAYDELIRKHSTAYGLDWRLMAAQAYQESRFDPEAKSWVGALGLFQVMPKTGAEMGFFDLKDPEIGIHAGVRYMAQMIDSFDKDVPFKHRVRFALASYNAGRGHVEDARRLATEMGLNPNKWFKNVELAMLKLQDHNIAKKAKHGYCRGEEPVKYVSEIQSRYDNYITIVPDPGLDAAAKKP
jgi:membrane-bound lytic murein transglycosylase F